MKAMMSTRKEEAGDGDKNKDGEDVPFHRVLLSRTLNKRPGRFSRNP